MERAREVAWQEVWKKAGLATAHRVPGREKFFGIVAYPGASGFLHVGHLRGLTYADALHRYHRMRGRQVFFPTGTHATGLPAVTFAQRVADRDPGVVAQLREHKVPESDWRRLEDPSEAARFLGGTYLKVFRDLGLLIDESAYTTSIDDDYQAFIRWQFGRLARSGKLVQAPYFAAVCPMDGPVAVDPTETDLSRGGEAEWIEFNVVPFPLDDGRILLTATLRPETVFGVTNLWVSPSERLVVWHQAERAFLVSRPAAEYLIEQHGGKLGREVPSSEVVGHLADVPLAGKKVPVLASRLVNPEVGTGVVMSVPAHAPADWLGLAELTSSERAKITEVPVIVEVAEVESRSSERELLAGPGTPAERALHATGARSLDDDPQVEEATERLYRIEYARGRMRVPSMEGMPVAAARESVAKRLRELPGGLVLLQFSEPVVCRNGHRVVIRRVSDQWFLHYADPDWKQKTRELTDRIEVLPSEYARELPEVVDWIQDRPCTRRGRWLGTPFPPDPAWVIEPLADSTLYPAFFIPRRYVARGQVPVSSLTPEFFDFVFLGEGSGEPSVDRATLDELREEFTYWYPLDLNIGGKEHKRVHFPFFVFHHALFFPPTLQPRGLVAYWWLVAPGGAKLSKKDVSKGGAIPPVRDAFERWGADALRLFFCSSASPFQDVEWDPSLVEQAAGRVNEVERLTGEALAPGAGGPPELEAWLLHETRETVRSFHESLERFDFRALTQRVYVDLPNLLRRYFIRGGTAGPATERLARAWIRLMSPVTPHLAEELGRGRFSGLVAEATFPQPEEFPASAPAVWVERYLERVEEDLKSVIKASEARGDEPHSLMFYVAAPWKRSVEHWLREEGPEPSQDLPRRIMERARSRPELAAFASEIPEYVKRVAPQLRSDPATPPDGFDEVRELKRVAGFLARRFGLSEVEVLPESEAGPYDPKGRRQRARPGRPAFYLTYRPRGRVPAEGSEPA